MVHSIFSLKQLRFSSFFCHSVLPRKYDWVLIFFFLYKYCILFYIGTHGIIFNPLNMNKFQNLIDFRWISSLILPRNHSLFLICGVVFFSAQIFKYYMFDYFLPSGFFLPLDNYNFRVFWGDWGVCLLLTYYFPSTFIMLSIYSFFWFINTFRERVVKWKEHWLWNRINLKFNPGITIYKLCDLRQSHLTSLILIFSSVKCREWYKLKKVMSSFW